MENKRKDEEISRTRGYTVHNLGVYEKYQVFMNKVKETEDNFSKNVKLQELNEVNLKNIYGEKVKTLPMEEKIRLFDRKINNCEIKENMKISLTLKNPNPECKYETFIYDDEGKLLGKTEKKDDKNEIILFENLDMDYQFTKPQSITVTIIKHISDSQKIKTQKVIPLKKLFSKNNSENLEERIDNFTDDELINIGFDLPEEKNDDKCIEINFNTEECKGNENSNISYSIQKGDQILFKSAFCNNSNIKGTDKLPLKLLEPEFEISFYNEDFTEKKIVVKTDELKNGISEIINLPNIENFKIKMTSEEVEKNSFIKLIKKGLNIDLSIAIDFTSSNGYPSEEDSLHKIKDGFINNYEKAIRENYKIISSYNKKDKYNIYGFGADINGRFEECFNLNGTEDPSIIGIENIISEYKKAVMNVGFSGGTYFAPVIKSISKKVKDKMGENLNYHLLLIISDGEIEDIDETIDSIIESAELPLSFIIIGVGCSVNSDMKKLNGEDGKLISSNGETLTKDIVQYVHFNDYADDINKLTEAVLKYIPGQISSYYKDKLKD